MTQEEKQLLLKDLCARLPYGVKVKIGEFSDYMLIGIDTANDKQPLIIRHADGIFTCSIDIIKPYLRPMSSMTEEEEKQFVQFHCTTLCPIVINDCLTIDNEGKMFDWLNAHHFDFRGLIEKGLALEVPEGMYETK